MIVRIQIILIVLLVSFTLNTNVAQTNSQSVVPNLKQTHHSQTPKRTDSCFLEGIIISRTTGKYSENDSVYVHIDSIRLFPNREGAFFIQNLSYGIHHLRISSNTHELFKSTITMEPGKNHYFVTCVLEPGKKSETIKLPTLSKDSVPGPPWTITGNIIDSRFDISLWDKELTMVFDSTPVTVTKKGAFSIQTNFRGTHIFHVSIPGYHDIHQTIELTYADKQPFITLATAPTDVAVTKRQLTVTAKKQPLHVTSSVAKIRITRKEFQRSSATANDPLRFIQSLPGVAAENDAYSRPVVRGGDVLETRISLDGISLVQPYHFGGVKSTLNQAALDNITFYKSGFPAKFSNAQSALIVAESRIPTKETYALDLDVNLLQYDLYVGLPFLDGTWGVNASAQGSYYETVLQSILSVSSNESIKEIKDDIHLPDYQDFSFGVGYRPGNSFQFFLNAIVNTDRFKSTFQNTVIPVTYYYPESATNPYDTITLVKKFPPHFDKDHFELNPPQKSPPFFYFTVGKIKEEIDTTLLYNANFSILYGLAKYQINEHNIVSMSTAWQRRRWDIVFPDEQSPWLKTAFYDAALDQYSLNLTYHCSYFNNHYFESGFQIDFTKAHYDVYTPRSLHEIITKGNTNFGDFLGPITQDEGISFAKGDSLINYINDISNRIHLLYKGTEDIFNGSGFLEDEITLNSKLTLSIGARLEYSSADHHKVISPRMSMKYNINEKHEFVTSTGLYTQNNYDFDALALSKDLKPEKVVHLGFGTESNVLPWLTQKIDVFGKYYYHLISERINPNQPLLSLTTIQTLKTHYPTINIDSLLQFDQTYLIYLANVFFYKNGHYNSTFSNNGKGYAYGLEYFLRYEPFDFWNGWFSFSWSTSMRQRHPGWRWHNFPLERPITVSLVNYYRLPRNYEISVNYRFMAGFPYTESSFATTVFEEVSADTSKDSTYIGPYNNKRYAPYQSLNFKIAKGFSIKNSKGHFYFEVWNGFNNPNSFLLDNKTKAFKTLAFNLPTTAVFLGVDFSLQGKNNGNNR